MCGMQGGMCCLSGPCHNSRHCLHRSWLVLPVSKLDDLLYLLLIVDTPQHDVLDSVSKIGQETDINHFAVDGGVSLEHDRSSPVSGFPIGAGPPPIHSKLVAKIEAGEFIELSELLCDQLGRAEAPHNSRQRTVTNILE